MTCKCGHYPLLTTAEPYSYPRTRHGPKPVHNGGNHMTKDEIRNLASKISEVADVSNVRIWDRVQNKERIYFDVMKASGRKTREFAVYCSEKTLSANSAAEQDYAAIREIKSLLA